MPHCWPEETDFAPWELDVLDRDCAVCGRMMHICDHRYRHFFTLEGPVQLNCRLNHCPDPDCPGHAQTKSPETEIAIAMPAWAIGWDVFCWIGHRRFARHWSIPQIRGELIDSYAITLSENTIALYIQRYQAMLAARQQDFEVLRRDYQGGDEIILSIDGLQPEKGHETLYVVRELTRKRVWFAEALLSATAQEVRRLIAQAKDWAEGLGKGVAVWISDKQDAFVTGIAAEFPGVPHRYCANHFLRDLAQPVLEADSQAKVRMRKRVRGLRGIERSVLKRRRDRAAAPAPASLAAADVREAAEAPAPASPPATRVREATDSEDASCAPDDAAGDVVLDYCAAVRGILNDDQGGPLHPPGLRMAAALDEVQQSLRRNLDANQGGCAERDLGRLARCIDRGLEAVRNEQETIRPYVADIQQVAETLEPSGGDRTRREAHFLELSAEFESRDDPIHQHMAQLMNSFQPGLFAGPEGADAVQDNLELERWFRLPKGHERRIHGHRHAGVRIVQEGPTMMLALDAHLGHPGPFGIEDLLPYRGARVPESQRQAVHRRKIMRKARSKTKRHQLLAELERRYLACSSRL
jgi:hypothetical protein